MSYDRDGEADIDYKIDELCNTLAAHQSEFNNWREEWREHRLHASDAMRKVTIMHEVIMGFSDHVRHLDELPLIANGIKGLQSKAIKYIGYLVFGTMFVLSIIICVLLMRDSIKDFKIPGWLEITSPKVESE